MYKLQHEFGLKGYNKLRDVTSDLLQPRKRISAKKII